MRQNREGYKLELKMEQESKQNISAIDKLRNRITKKLSKEFNDKEISLLWSDINELIELELEIEGECNQ